MEKLILIILGPGPAGCTSVLYAAERFNQY